MAPVHPALQLHVPFQERGPRPDVTRCSSTGAHVPSSRPKQPRAHRLLGWSGWWYANPKHLSLLWLQSVQHPSDVSTKPMRR